MPKKYPAEFADPEAGNTLHCDQHIPRVFLVISIIFRRYAVLLFYF